MELFCQNLRFNANKKIIKNDNYELGNRGKVRLQQKSLRVKKDWFYMRNLIIKEKETLEND